MLAVTGQPTYLLRYYKMTSLATQMLSPAVTYDLAAETKRIETAYNKLGIREPFVAAVMSKIKREVVDDPRIPTAATNGSWCKYNPIFTCIQSDPQLFGLVLHESLHVILMHMWRRNDRDPRLWNYANDGIINYYIRSRGYELPDGGVDIKWVTEAMSSEEAYRRCKEEQPEPPEQPEQPESGDEGEGEGDDDGQGQGESDDGEESDGGGAGDEEGEGEGQGSGSGKGQGQGQGQGGAGDEEDDGTPQGGWNNSGDLLDADDEATLADLEATIVTAAQMAKTCGQGSAMIDRILDEVGTPSVHWGDVCREMMTASAKGDFSLSRPNRRYVWQNIFMPSLLSEAVGALLIGFDVSGSITQEEATQIAAEITAIGQDLCPEFIEVVYCDTQITRIERFEQGDEVELNVVAGGGTAFGPVFDYLENSEEQYAGVIYFTDMCGSFSGLTRPEIPCIWANTYGKHGRSSDVPFGTIVDVEL